MGIIREINVITGEPIGDRNEEIGPFNRFVPGPISARQFYQNAANGGFITESEALAVMTDNVLPASMVTFISTLPSSEQFAAKMLLIGANTFIRSHPMADQIGTMFSLSPEDLDTFWIEASQL